MRTKPARALALSATLLLTALATAPGGLAGVETQPPATGSISMKNYLPELERLQQAADWVGLERAARQALSTLSERNGPKSADADAASFWLGKAFEGEGRYAEAEPLYQRSVDFTERAFGPNHRTVAVCLNSLANLYRKQGQYAKAEALYQRVLGIDEKALGADHPGTATALGNLAGLYQVQGEYGKAEPLYQRALVIRENALGPDHPDVAWSLDHLADLYDAQGQYARAEPLYQRALRIYEKARGPAHPSVAGSLNGLATLHQAQGEYAKAEPLYQRALRIYEKALGPDHPSVAKSLNDLAALYQAQGEYAKAEPLYQRALRIYEKALGSGHPDVATTLNNLAGLYLAQGQQGKAEQLFRRALDVREQVLGANHPDVATSLNDLAEVYSDQRQYGKAELLLQRAVGIWESALGPNHDKVATGLNNLAGVYWAQREYAKAEPLLRRAVDIEEKVQVPGHPTVAQMLSNLAALYHVEGRYPDAEPLYLRALGIQEKTLGPYHPAVAGSLHNLAFLYDARGLHVKAEPLYQRALDIRVKALGPDHPDTTITRESLAYSNFLQGQFGHATVNYRLACAAQAAGVRSSNQSGEMTPVVETSVSRCSTFQALSLWGWSTDGGGAVPADRPDALRLEAFETSQRAVQSAAGSALARSAALTAANSAGVGPEARDYEAALLERERLDVEYAKAAAAKSTEGLNGLAKAHDEVVSKIRHLETVLRTKAPLYWDYRVPAPVSVAALQATSGPDSTLLRENEALVLFLVPTGRERGLVYAVSRERVAWARIGATGSDLQAAVVRLRAEIDPEGYALHDFPGEAVASTPRNETLSASTSTTPTAFDRRSAYQLYQVLLGDASVQQVIRNKAVLLFVPSGPLTALPPGLLVTAAPGGAETDDDPSALRATAWLLRSKAVAILPAVSSLRTLRQILPAHGSTPDPLLAFADPVFTPPGRGLQRQRAARPRAFKTYFRDGIPLAQAMDGLPALPGTRIEAEALRRALGAPPGSLLLGRDASKAQLMARNADGRLAQVRVLEFATHGLVAGDLSDVAEPGLVLAAGSKPEDILLLASEASTLRLKADWVLLSACNTASPDAPEAQGLSGLSRAFFYAGARSLLVSHWLVRDEVAPLLIPAVLQAERDDPHLSRAEALRKASLAILDDPHLDAASPAAWAAFTLVGEAGRD